ncbi:hypothetical protein ACE01N_08575 [Saccharicrinis sp. FJH2]|uniref:hypothetical protein n=1 Tax=Saccharicrinis sp. FJH65 TaxID=3344659 RepID=UPI0035F296C4
MQYFISFVSMQLKIRLYHIICSLCIVSGFQTFAQQLEYDVQFYGFGDNREYDGYDKAISQTMLGERTSFALGTTLEGNNSFRFGLDHLFEFGSGLNEKLPKLIAYYQYEDDKKTFYFGAFPRMNLIDFPLALITDTFNYYRPNIDGFYADYRWKWGHQAGFVDWTSRQTDNRRETFMAALNGEIRGGSFFFQNYLTLFHYAGKGIRLENEFVEDNLALALYLGSDLDELLPLQKGYIRTGVLESTYRNRGEGNTFQKSWSFTAELYAEIKYFALRANISQGDGLHITNGDRYYDLKSYLRTDVIWKFLQKEHVEGHFNLSFHLLNFSVLDQSQQLALVYRFGK